ncbi:MAG: 16S rRNA (guanine(527)-N(7))-methyltransferase RsmG [Aestuariivirgaceae bacterium]|nr:16S rRNA (guanine(527)-N(7))-methyltransferase RsmG [Aestuariivirgaceae bacterium]
MIERHASPEEICAQFRVSRESCEALKAYAAVLLKWQARINLIGPATAGDFWHRHIADGLQLLPFLDGKSAPQTIVDLGSGGGVPGLVLAIARPDWKIHLVESNNKKAAFLLEASRLAGVKVEIHGGRIEKLEPQSLGLIDWVTARALAPLPALMELAFPLLKTARGLFHKGQDVDVELTATTKCWNMEFQRHASLIDAQSSILEIIEVRRRDEFEPEA